MSLELPGNKCLAGYHAPSFGISAPALAPAPVVVASAPVERQPAREAGCSFGTGETEGFLILDNNIGKSNKSNTPNTGKCDQKTRRKIGSMKHCLLSGFDNWISKGYENDFYWLTLSSPVGSRPIQESWNQFKFEVRRLTDRKLKKNGFIKRMSKNPDEKYLFEASVCFTSEGNGVAHIIFVGRKLPVKWIRETWNRIHGLSANYTGNVQFRIEHIKPSELDREKLTRYVLTQYVLNQKGYIRHSKTENWVYKGYRKDWLTICRKYDGDWSKVYSEWHTRVITHTDETPVLESIVKPRPAVLLDSGIKVEIPYVYGTKFEFPHQKEARLERWKLKKERCYAT